MSSDAEDGAARGMPLEHWSYQLRIAARRAVEDAPQLGVAETLDRVGRLVRLAILAEPASDGGEAFIDQFVQRVVTLFDPTERSLTGALRHAVETAHQELRGWNQQRLPADRAAYGLSCVIQREDGTAILAQAGPAAALLAGGAGIGGLRRMTLHQHTAHTASADLIAPAAVGADEPLTLTFASAVDGVDQPAEPHAAAGWALLLTSNAAALLDAERRVTLSRLSAADALRELYPALLQLRDAAVLAVVMGASEPHDPSAPPQDPQPSDAATAEIEDAPDDQGPAQDQAQDQLAAEPPDSEQRGWLQGTSELSERRPTPRQLVDWSADAALIAPLDAAVIAPLDWPDNPFAQRGMERVTTLSPPIAVAVAAPTPANEPIFELAAALPFLRERWDTPVADPPPIAMSGGRRGSTPRGRGPAARRAGLLLASMLVVLAAVAAVLLGPALLESDADELSAQIDRARNSVAAAQLALETDAARLALEDARAEVAAALVLNPLAADALQLRDEIEAALAELSLVQAPGELTPTADLSSYGPAIALGAVVVGDAATGAFVLDDAGGRVFQVDADGAVSVIFLEGELLGLDAELRAGRPISIAWQSAAETAGAVDSALWILDANARLFRWTVDGVLLIPVPDLLRLGSVDAVAATAGGIYLLDGAGGAIWRFAVEPGGAELAAPILAVGRTDLLEANEFRAVVTASGEVEFVVAATDGRLRRYGSSGERALAAGLTGSLVSPASLSLGAQSGLIYVVDRAEGRLITIGPDGNAVSLIQSPQLEGLRGAHVDEASGQIIYALPDQLLRGRLPARSEQ